jgi:predicted RNase H-like nuclease (RuvC/YqgF family)
LTGSQWGKPSEQLCWARRKERQWERQWGRRSSVPKWEPKWERQWERWLADAENKMQELTEFKESLEDENEKLGKTVGELRAALAKVRRSPSK